MCDDVCCFCIVVFFPIHWSLKAMSSVPVTLVPLIHTRTHFLPTAKLFASTTHHRIIRTRPLFAFVVIATQMTLLLWVSRSRFDGAPLLCLKPFDEPDGVLMRP